MKELFLWSHEPKHICEKNKAQLGEFVEFWVIFNLIYVVYWTKSSFIHSERIYLQDVWNFHAYPQTIYYLKNIIIKVAQLAMI